MALSRYLVPAFVGVLALASTAHAQGTTGTITGRVVDSSSSQPLESVNLVVMGAQRGSQSRDDGSFTIVGVPAGTYTVRASRIGYRPMTQSVTVTAGGTESISFMLSKQAAVLSEIVVTGYGTQRREAISGSVATVNADQADVGVVTNANQMLQARVAGVQMTQNSGEPGAGLQVRIRGGTSISASNEPLYVVDGVPLQNEQAAPGAAGIGSINPQLSRSPLNSINPGDIESITVLKDAAATAIYGSRGANGVVLITTKRGVRGGGQTEYDVYVAAATPAKRLELATGDQYRAFINDQIQQGKLPATSAAALGTANTDWEKAITHTGLTNNHNLSFSGGSDRTQYRASLNYFDQQGVVLENGLRRYQGRLNANHDALEGHLRLALNLMASRVNNSFAPIENGGGFLGGLFTNMVIFNPTQPIRAADGSYYEVGLGAQDVRNPVGIVESLSDHSPENRLLGNVTATVGLLQDLTAQTTLGADNSDASRETFAPVNSPIGAAYGGFARQAQRHLQNLNFQQLVTYSPRFGSSEFEMVGGYEYTKIDNRGFEAASQGFITSAFGVDNLAAGTKASSPVPTSYHVESQLASFFTRLNYGYANRYFLTGVLRYDGSSRLAPGHQWETFPAISGSWRLSEESFFPHGFFTNFALRAGIGKQGNQSVEPYQTQLLLRADPGAIYPFGNTLTTGLRAAQVGNSELKWETSTQTNVGVDYSFLQDRFTGTFEVYQKKTRDLLLEVGVPQPAVVSTRIENVGSLTNRGVEAALDGELWHRGKGTITGGLVFTLERNKVDALDADRTYINTSDVSGQGQSNQYSQRIMIGQPLGTFFGPKFLGVNSAGQQTYSCVTPSTSCVSGVTTNPTEDDKIVLGSANPDFTIGLRNNATMGKVDFSWLWRGEFGGKVFNNTALVYQSKSLAKQGRNFLAATLEMPDDISEPAKFSSRWVEDRTFVRLQNVTLGYTFNLPARLLNAQSTRVYVSGDNLLLFTGYSGYDPEVFTSNGNSLATRGVDYLSYPRARTFSLGAQVKF